MGRGGEGSCLEDCSKRRRNKVYKDKIKRGGFFTVSRKFDYSVPRSYDPHCSSLGYGM